MLKCCTSIILTFALYTQSLNSHTYLCVDILLFLSVHIFSLYQQNAYYWNATKKVDEGVNRSLSENTKVHWFRSKGKDGWAKNVQRTIGDQHLEQSLVIVWLSILSSNIVTKIRTIDYKEAVWLTWCFCISLLQCNKNVSCLSLQNRIK